MGNIESFSANSSILSEEPNLNYGVSGLVCASCGEFKEFSKFSINRSNKSGYARYCKLCNSIGRPMVVPKIKRYCSECAKDITSRVINAVTCSRKCAIQRNDRKSKGDQFLIFNRDGCRCQYCGKTPSEDEVKIVCDHIIPKIDGGSDTADNLVTCCAKCNSAKSDKKLNPDTMNLIIKSVTEKNLKFGISPKKIITGSHCRLVNARQNEQYK
jgi:5-methylcytosine-specific restriction endonuclease McrA